MTSSATRDSSISKLMRWGNKLVDNIQGTLDYSGCTGPQFADKRAAGRIGTTGCLLGVVAGIHIGVFTAAVTAVYLVNIIQAATASSDLVADNPTSAVIANIDLSFLYALLIWCTYMIFLCCFHFMEFFVTAISQPSTLSNDSYIIHHSSSYTIAAVASWIEFWLEYFLLRGNKFFLVVSVAGILLVLLGQCIRSVAMLHCGENFSHQIMDEKRSNHRLVTTGIYSVLRHPSYFGWFYWSLGTQLILCNPLCSVLYVLAALSFFRDRVDYEERLLMKFYEKKYVDYCKHTIVGIPGVVSPADAAVREQQQQ